MFHFYWRSVANRGQVGVLHHSDILLEIVISYLCLLLPVTKSLLVTNFIIMFLEKWNLVGWGA